MKRWGMCKTFLEERKEKKKEREEVLL